MEGESFNDIDTLAAKRLKMRRKIMGISVERMAFVLRTTPDHYRQMEDAETPISSDIMDEFAYLLNVPVRHFSSKRDN